MYMSTKEYIAALGGYNLIEKQARQLAEDYVSEFGYGIIKSVDVEADEITGEIEITTYYSNCGCCGPDYEYYTIPISYLWDEDWKKKETVKRDTAKAETEKRRAKEKAEEAKKREKARYQSYLAMKEEYEK